MNRLESALLAALRAEAEDAAQSVDATRAAAQVDARLDRVDRGRRRRVWVTVAAVGTTAAVVTAIVLAGRQLNQAAPEPPTGPAPSATGRPFTLAKDPFMTDADLAQIDWQVARYTGADRDAADHAA